VNCNSFIAKTSIAKTSYRARRREGRYEKMNQSFVTDAHFESTC
jgi:hypothetical protein